MRIGSSINKQAVRSTGRCVRNAGGGGGCRTDARVGGVQGAFVSQFLNVRKGKALVRRKTRRNVEWQNFRPARGYVAHGSVARGLCLLLPSLVGVRIVSCGITELQFGSCAEGVQVGRGDGRCVSCRRNTKGVPTASARSRSDVMVPSGSARQQEPGP